MRVLHHTYYFSGAHKIISQYSGVPGGSEKALADMRASGVSREILEDAAYKMALHDITEFSHPGSMLPALYAEFGKKVMPVRF